MRNNDDQNGAATRDCKRMRLIYRVRSHKRSMVLLFTVNRESKKKICICCAIAIARSNGHGITKYVPQFLSLSSLLSSIRLRSSSVTSMTLMLQCVNHLRSRILRHVNWKGLKCFLANRINFHRRRSFRHSKRKLVCRSDWLIGIAKASKLFWSILPKMREMEFQNFLFLRWISYHAVPVCECVTRNWNFLNLKTNKIQFKTIFHRRQRQRRPHDGRLCYRVLRWINE